MKVQMKTYVSPFHFGPRFRTKFLNVLHLSEIVPEIPDLR